MNSVVVEGLVLFGSQSTGRSREVGIDGTVGPMYKVDSERNVSCDGNASDSRDPRTTLCCTDVTRLLCFI